jgi:hypothetical protein
MADLLLTSHLINGGKETNSAEGLVSAYGFEARLLSAGVELGSIRCVWLDQRRRSAGG